MVDSINPVNSDSNALIPINPLTIKVGKLGTNPVLKNFTNIGMNSIKVIMASINAIIPKNLVGL